MSTQTPPTPKGPRNARRQQRKNLTPYSQTKSFLTTPPSSPPRSSSPGDVIVDSGNHDNGGASKKKNGRSGKKPRDNPKASPAPNRANGHRHTSSQPNIASPSQLRDSPHYAGPTFHASPAPSALPMPSFFSKSVPDSDLAPALELDDHSSELDHVTESTPSKPKARNLGSDGGRESSPLDFLFKAAVEARDKSRRSPEAYNGNGSPPYTDSKAYPARRKPESSTGGIFPLELEASDMQSMPIGPSFATPYKDRMNALRSTSSPSQSPADLDEAQRRAKTEALKNLLLNPRPQRPASASPFVSGQSNGHPALTPNASHYSVPLRTSSGPPAPVSFGQHDQSQAAIRHGSRNSTHYQYVSPLSGGSQKVRASSSALRQEISPSSTFNVAGLPAGAAPPASAPSSQTGFHDHRKTPSTYASPTRQRPAYSRDVSAGLSGPDSKELDTKRMEDDLRRILKLDMASSVHSNGVQSSLA